MAGSTVESDRTPSLVGFFVATFVFTWAFWVPGLLVFGDEIREKSPLETPEFFVLQTIGAAGPSVVAYRLLRRDGRASIEQIFARYKLWRVGVKWFLVSAFLVPAIMAVGVLIGGVVGDGPMVDESSDLNKTLEDLGVAGLIAMFPIFIVGNLPSSPLLEEFGLRGFALPRLQDRFPALTASLILGLLWGLWHLPLMLAHQDPVIPGLLRITAITVLITWVFNNTSGSMLLAMLFHASLNASIVLLSTEAGRWPSVLLTIAVAAAVVAYNGHRDLGPNPRASWSMLTKTYAPAT